jgi:transcriptional regulator with XRE-family HTH domain
MMPFGVVLRQYRRQAEMSCAQLAQEAAVNPSYISRLENGWRDPPRRLIAERLAKALLLPPDEAARLLAAAGYVPIGPVGSALRPNRQRDQLVEAIEAVLADPALGVRERKRFRRVLALLVTQWAGRVVEVEVAS